MPVMSNHSHLSHDELVLHYYGDAGPDAARFDTHLGECEACRTALDRLTRALSLVDASPAEEPAPGFEARVWARLEPALAPAVPWWRRLLDVPAVRWAPAGFAMAALIAAFAGGWMLRSTTTSPATQEVSGSAPRTPPPEAPALQTRVLVLAVGDHLDRAEIALSELMNTGAVMDDLDRSRAADLVATNRLVRQTAVQAGDEALDEVLDEIGRVLVELANAPTDVSVEELEDLRQRVESRGILFRMRVIGNDLRTRQQPTPAVPATKGKTS
jgi:hypothetical protein